VKWLLDALEWGMVAPAVLFFLKLLPFAAMWIMFSFVYVFMPNTKVDPRAGLLGGVAAGTAYQLTQWVYLKFQIGVSGYGAVYGSFAALPLFLAWLNLSWTIVLWGAEISFAAQNLATYEFEPDCLEVSPAFKRLLTLRVTAYAVQRFSEGSQAPTEADFTRELDIPIRLVRLILDDLVNAEVLVEVFLEGDRDKAYQPSRSEESLTIKGVLDLLDHKGSTAIPVIESDELKTLRASLDAFSRALRDSPANLLLKDL
jgi:membrane protein